MGKERNTIILNILNLLPLIKDNIKIQDRNKLQFFLEFIISKSIIDGGYCSSLTYSRGDKYEMEKLLTEFQTNLQIKKYGRDTHLIILENIILPDSGVRNNDYNLIIKCNLPYVIINVD